MANKCLKNFTGMRFGRLYVVEFRPDESKYSRFLCRCDCGTEKLINGFALTSGNSRSCGCAHAEAHQKAHKTHGHTAGGRQTPTYKSWAGMMTRCEWGNHPSFEQYGAKGIRVDPRWHSFESFISDMGERPHGKSIDRIDNSAGYFNGNCRWATQSEQSLNTSRTVKVMYCGELVPVVILCRDAGLSIKAVRARAQRRKGDFVAALKSFGIDVQPRTI